MYMVKLTVKVSIHLESKLKLQYQLLKRIIIIANMAEPENYLEQISYEFRHYYGKVISFPVWL